ncbi:hypothetical protein D3C76_1398870 [compost metagenome]
MNPANSRFRGRSPSKKAITARQPDSSPAMAMWRRECQRKYGFKVTQAHKANNGASALSMDAAERIVGIAIVIV